MTLKVQRLDSMEQLAALGPAIEGLVSRMRPQTPFAQEPWLRLWWQHYREARLLLRDKLFLRACFDDDERLVGLAPLMLTERPGDGPCRVRVLRFLGGDKNITELRGLICAPEDEVRVTRSLLGHLAASASEWDWFSWDHVREGAAQAELGALSNFHWTSELADYVLHVSDSWEAFKSTRSRNIKESLRKCYNSLKRDNHRFEFRVLSGSDELESGVHRFLELHRRRAGAEQLSDHADYFRTAPARKLLLGLVAEPERAPCPRLFELWVGESVVASRVGFVLPGELYLYFSGFEPAWSRYSVMTTTVAEAIKWAIGQGIRRVNLSTGTDFSKTRWGPERVVFKSGVLVSPAPFADLKWNLATRLSRSAASGSPLARFVDMARRRA